MLLLFVNLNTDTVLIVDPDSSARGRLHSSLVEQNYVVREASNSDTALRICSTESVALVLCAYELDQRTGIELFECISNTRPFIRGILLAESMTYGLLTKIVETRFDDCLQKSCPHSDLMESIAQSFSLIVHWRVRFRSFLNPSKKADTLGIVPYQHLADAGIKHQEEQGGLIINANDLLNHDQVHVLIAQELELGTFVYLDFSDTQHINSEQIASVVMLKNTLIKCGGDLSIYNLNDFIYQVFSSMRLLHKLNQTKSLHQAKCIERKRHSSGPLIT